LAPRLKNRIIRQTLVGITFSIILLPLMSLFSYANDETAELSFTATGPHIQVSLLSEQVNLVPGTQVMVGVLFEPDPQWHTYWRNPGDSGEAPTIKWQAQSQASLGFGEIQWPLPQAIPVAHLVNYGYDGHNLLMVPVDVPEEITLGQNLEIIADISWLVCKEDCIPGWATLKIELPVASEAVYSEHSSRFIQTKTQLPTLPTKQGFFEVIDNNIVFEVPEVRGQEWHLFPFRSDLINHAGQQQVVGSDNGKGNGSAVQFVVPRSPFFDGNVSQLKWLISNGVEGYYVSGQLSENAMANASGAEASFSQDLWLLMLMAFAGGLILNLMPCVLPILSIKAMAVQNMSQKLTHKLAYLVGVLFCFNLFALLIIALQQGGQQIGWGFHMQEPIVVVLLAFLFTFIALVLLDAIGVSSRFAGIGNGLVSGETALSHFSTGALAVIVASPCTAPFMAAALGVAFVSEPSVTLLLFNALALGFALPLTLLFMWSRAIAWLPKPGPWMVTFKHFLAFPMFITVAWLCWVFAGQLGVQAQFGLLLALILFCMFAWLLGKANKTASIVLVSVGLLSTLAIPLWLSFSAIPQASLPSGGASQDSISVPYTAESLSELRDTNNVVVVNMTADWCITCKVNEQVALSSDTVKTALSQDGVVYMVGDWTNKNAEILNYLGQYERAGVPLYVVYAGNNSKQVLPQILTTNTVINAINNAKEELENVN
jgi:thiol:disulfide interchange protein DsbD